MRGPGVCIISAFCFMGGLKGGKAKGKRLRGGGQKAKGKRQKGNVQIRVGGFGISHK